METPCSDKTAQNMVTHLMQEGMSATDISDAMGQRVSRRTIYRWAKGESEPQQASDLVALKKIYTEAAEGKAAE